MKYAVWFFLIGVIIFRYFSTKPVFRDGDRVRITTTILSDPIQYSTSLYLKISGLKVYLPAPTEISYGDRIILEGVVSKDKLEKPKIIKIFSKKSFISSFRDNIVEFYQKILPQPEAGLIAGITLGSKSALTSDFWKKVKNVGVAHVVVASGTNITFVTSFLLGVLSTLLPRKKAILFVILGIIFYLFISGFEAPLIRAAIMSSVAFLGEATGRLVSTWKNLALTALVMLAIKPEWIGDIGFILSFVSTLSLMLFEKRIRNLLKRVPEVLKEGLSTSLAAQIGVAPILIVSFGQFNVLSPVANALVLWTIPYIMIVGAVGGVAGLILAPVGRLVLYLAYPLAWWFVVVVQLFN